MDRGGAGEIHLFSTEESRERDNPSVHRESEWIFQSTGKPTDKGMQTERATEEGTIPKTPISQEVYAEGHCPVGQD